MTLNSKKLKSKVKKNSYKSYNVENVESEDIQNFNDNESKCLTNDAWEYANEIENFEYDEFF